MSLKMTKDRARMSHLVNKIHAQISSLHRSLGSFVGGAAVHGSGKAERHIILHREGVDFQSVKIMNWNKKGILFRGANCAHDTTFDNFIVKTCGCLLGYTVKRKNAVDRPLRSERPGGD